MFQAVISLGSNINKEDNLPAAVGLLAEQATAVAVSAVYETLPVGLREQDNFFNAAVLIETTQSPEELKGGLLSDIERQLKRVRQADKNAPRTIDLDIAWYDGPQRTYPGPDGRLRRLPDPDVLHFTHVALPLADLLPETGHPDTGESFAAIAQRLQAADTAGTIWRRNDIDLTPLLRPA